MTRPDPLPSLHRAAAALAAAGQPEAFFVALQQAMAEVKSERTRQGRAFTRAALYEAIMLGAVERVRPKMMTVVAIMAGLLPILWGTGTGSEVMSRIAAPMVGGMISSTVLTLAVIPALYALIKEWQLKQGVGAPPEGLP